MYDFLFVILELFLLALTVDRLWYSHICAEKGR